MKYTIYKIFEIETPTQFYIGSTKRFSSRKSHHKKNVNNKVGKLYWCKLYQFIRSKGGWEKFTMEIIETIESENKVTVRQKEQQYINTLCPPLNCINACSSIPIINNII